MTGFFLERDPIAHDGCAHCPPGIKCEPTTGACINGKLSLVDSSLKFVLLFC